MIIAAHEKLFVELGLDAHPRFVPEVSGSESPEQGIVVSFSPATGQPIGGVRLDTPETYESTLAASVEAFKRWREVPAPLRGQVVRAIGDELRTYRDALGELIALEVGKIKAEGIGEVQETIDIADFAVGLSRQLHGITMPSERPNHSMKEQWLPIGPIGVITAFNFPNAVWGWNAMLAAVCGDTVIWKPSLLAPLTAMATNRICAQAAERMGHRDLFRLLIGTDDVIGERLIRDRRLPLISATGSCRMGRHVSSVVGGRLGRCLLELGGNNAAIVTQDADLDTAIKHIVFGAVGTAGQRCTTTRRLIVHESIIDDVCDRLVRAYGTITIGDPRADGVLVGPLITENSVEQFESAISAARDQGGELLVGGTRASPDGLEGGHYVNPAVVRVPEGKTLEIEQFETFAPILYVSSYSDLDEAIERQNSVEQGLSSAIFTSSSREAERFLAPSGSGSDCGIANVNIGTSGAEIGGAFGGEKDTGGGRESGSDAWKAYMRRQTCTTNFGTDFALAQGIRFE